MDTKVAVKPRYVRLGELFERVSLDIFPWVLIGIISDNVWVWGGRRRPFILVGGVLAGIGLGNGAVIYAYISAVIAPNERSFAVSAMQFAIAFAFMVGPFTGRRKFGTFVFATMLATVAGARVSLAMLTLFSVGATLTFVAVLRSEWSRRGVAPGSERG